jgi:hypothetical protein
MNMYTGDIYNLYKTLRMNLMLCTSYKSQNMRFKSNEYVYTSDISTIYNLYKTLRINLILCTSYNFQNMQFKNFRII